MCVIVAKRIRLHGTDKRNWFLYKIRDRVYKPEYDVAFDKQKGVESIYLTDNVNDWTEGCSSSGMMIVSAALQNHADEKDGEENPDPTKPMKVSNNGKMLRRCLAMKKCEDVIKEMKDSLFTGNTFVSDGDRLFVLECYIKQSSIDREMAKINVDDYKFTSEIHQAMMKGIKREDYVMKSVQITDSDLVVRTNHGILLPEAGFQKDDEDPVGYKSSHSRYNYVYDAMSDLNEETHPFEILTILKNLGSDKVDKDPKMRPIRIFGATEYFSGCVVLLTPTGTLYVVPIECTFATTNFRQVNQDKKVAIVVLPRDMPLFEGRRGMYERIKVQEYEKYLW